MTPVRDLIEGVAHAVNNSLSNIRLAGEVIVEDLEESTPQEPLDADFLKGKLMNIIGEVDRARAVLGELFQVSRSGHFEKVSLPLKALVNRAVAAQRGISDRVHVEVTVDDDLTISGDEHMLTTALANLVSDALFAINEAGYVAIHACRQPEGVVEVSVSNNGRALAEQDLARLFEPFYSTKKAKRGKGLGLYVPYRIVRSHNGGMCAENLPDGGTTIRLKLPSGEDGV
jgi:signal transduction histidine kinase